MRRDRVVGLFGLALGIIYCLLTWNLPRATIGNPVAPLVFPAILGGLLVTVSAGVLIVDARLASTGHADKPNRHDPGYVRLVAGTIVLCPAYGFVFEHLGYLFSTIPFLFALLTLYNEPRRWKFNLIVTLAFTLALWAIFLFGFQINLPTFFQGDIV